MKAVVMHGFGGPEVMEIAEVTTPEPGPNQVRVRVLATSVNRADIIQRQGHYPPPPGESDILGLEVAGRIDALGAGVSGWNLGDRVMGIVAGGGYAEYALAYADHLIPIPSIQQRGCEPRESLGRRTTLVLSPAPAGGLVSTSILTASTSSR